MWKYIMCLGLSFALTFCSSDDTNGKDDASKELTAEQEKYLEIRGQLRASRAELEELLKFQDATMEQKDQIREFYDDILHLSLEEITKKYNIPEEQTGVWLQQVEQSIQPPDPSQAEEPLLKSEGVIEDTL